MHWLLQLGLETGHYEEAMLDALVELGLPHTCVKIVPFSHELQPSCKDVEGKVTVYGGTVLRKIAREMGWDPGYYWNEETFHFEAWREHWGKHLLNHDSVVCRFGDVPLQHDRFFMRPCVSKKTFTAAHLDWDDYQEWLRDVENGEVDHRYQGLTPDTPVAVASYKEIQAECRFFIAGGRIVTGSFYRRLTSSKRIPFFDSPWYDPEMERYVQDRIEQWQPHRAFVLDVAEIAEGFKIIEVNAYNSSGLYECDAEKVILGLEELNS